MHVDEPCWHLRGLVTTTATHCHHLLGRFHLTFCPRWKFPNKSLSFYQRWRCWQTETGCKSSSFDVSVLRFVGLVLQRKFCSPNSQTSHFVNLTSFLGKFTSLMKGFAEADWKLRSFILLVVCTAARQLGPSVLQLSRQSSGIIIGLPVWKWESWKIWRTKWV